jgi:hypothetical protein
LVVAQIIGQFANVDFFGVHLVSLHKLDLSGATRPRLDP